MRFLAQNRERVRLANPDTSFPDVTKLLAAEWTAMPPEEKQVYLDEAEKDKERYLRELEEYKTTESFRMFQAKKQGRDKDHDGKNARKADKVERGREKEAPKEPSNSTDIPIFTEEFLEHNRQREGELRQLRKLNTEYEEQNAILSKHIENLRAACEKFDAESALNRKTTKSLEEHITALGAMLVQKLDGIAIPGTGETPNLENIESFIVKLHQKLVKDKGNKENDALAEKVQSIIANINPDDVFSSDLN